MSKEKKEGEMNRKMKSKGSFFAAVIVTIQTHLTEPRPMQASKTLPPPATVLVVVKSVSITITAPLLPVIIVMTKVPT